MGELLRVTGLKKYFPVTKGFFKRQVASVKAVDGVDFSIQEGETFGLVGESGCGKTTVGKMVLRLLDATDGEIEFDGRDIRQLDKKQMCEMRKQMQIVFQDPYGSLNPRMTVHDILAEPIRKHKLASGEALEQRVVELLRRVELNEREMKKFPHEFSGGQRQRICIARALAVNPRVRCRSTRSSCCSTSRSPHWTSRYSPKYSTCSRSCNGIWAWPIFSSRTGCRWSAICPTG